MSNEQIYVPTLNTETISKANQTSSESLIDSNDWLPHANTLLSKEVLENNDWLLWAAYHASKVSSQMSKITPSMALPLFREPAHSPMMIYHGMNVIAAITKHLNPNQSPVLVMDQPLFTLGKKIQWEFPDTLGEDKFVLMLGTMHTEKMMLEMLGHWLNGSGWTAVLTNSGIASSGVAQSLIGVSHLTCTRYFHQVTSLALYSLLLEAYGEYLVATTDDPPMNFKDWQNKQKLDQPQFLFWHQTMELELTLLQFVKSLRTADFKLYLEVLKNILPWVFLL